MGRPINIHRYGGPISRLGAQLAVKAFVAGSVKTCGLIQQKKQRTFKVIDSLGNTEICTFVNSATPALGEMSLKIIPVSGPAFFAKKITNRFVWDFNNNKYSWAFATSGNKVIAEAL
jgi:hypothetical protein